MRGCLQLSDWVRLSLAGNLATFRFADRHGNMIAGSQLDYNGQPAGYTADPQENISYIDAHDNETLFDAIQFKAAVSNMADRVRMQNLGLSIVALGQGIPFIHARPTCAIESRSTATATTRAIGSTCSTSPTRPTTGAWGCRRRATTRRTGRSCGRCSRTPRCGRRRRTSGTRS